MGNLSAPILLAASTPMTFEFVPRSAISLQIFFFSDTAGLVARPAGEGTATITVTRQTVGSEGPIRNPTPVALPVSNFAGGQAELVPGATIQAFGLAGGANTCIVTATAVVNGAALTYRLHHDGEAIS